MNNTEFKVRLIMSKSLFDILKQCELGDTIRIYRNETFVEYVIKNDEYDTECFILENVEDDTEMWTDGYSLEELIQNTIVSYIEGKCDKIVSMKHAKMLSESIEK